MSERLSTEKAPWCPDCRTGGCLLHDGQPTAENVTRYRKRPVEVDAIQFTGENGEAVVAFTGGVGRLESAACYGDGPPYLVMIDTLEGRMCAGRHDYVIRGVEGEFYPCKPGIFEATYEPVAPSIRPDSSPTPDGAQ